MPSPPNVLKPFIGSLYWRCRRVRQIFLTCWDFCSSWDVHIFHKRLEWLRKTWRKLLNSSVFFFCCLSFFLDLWFDLWWWAGFWIWKQASWSFQWVWFWVFLYPAHDLQIIHRRSNEQENGFDISAILQSIKSFLNADQGRLLRTKVLHRCLPELGHLSDSLSLYWRNTSKVQTHQMEGFLVTYQRWVQTNKNFIYISLFLTKRQNDLQEKSKELTNGT